MAKIETVLQGFSLSTDQGLVAFCSVTLVRGSRNILVDAAHVGRRPLLVQRLGELGLAPSDIDAVFLTHAHWDHILNIDLFPNAEFLIHPAELEYTRHPHSKDWATPAYTSSLLGRYRLREVKDGEEIDDGIRVMETFGHSAGSMSLLVQADGEIASVCGDTLPNGFSVKSGEPRMAFWSLDQAKASIRKLLDNADIFYPGHDRPFRVKNGGVQYLEKTGIKIFGLPQPGEGEGPHAITYNLGTPVAAELVLPE